MRLTAENLKKVAEASVSTKGTADDKPIIIKPPALARQNYLRTPSRQDDSQRAVSGQPKKILRNNHVRNPKEPQGARSPIKFRKRNDNGVDCNPDSADDEFYRSLRKNGLKSSREPKAAPKPDKELPTSPSMRGEEFERLRDIADDARETKTVLQEWKNKIESLEANLKEQDSAMHEVLRQNEELESQVATLNRKEMMYQRNSGHTRDPSIQYVVEENKALEMEVERLRRNQLDKALVESTTQEIINERNRFRTKEKQLEHALSMAREENERLIQEVNSKRIENSEGQAMLDRNRLLRKEAQLERSLAGAQNENNELLMELRSRNLDFDKKERQIQKQAEELRTLKDELEMNRRIVHTKRSLIRKEMTDESMELLRKEMKDELTIELTAKISEDLRVEKEKNLKEMREEDEEKVREVMNQIPILENEIDRLRKNISHAKKDHAQAISSIEAQHQKKVEFMVNNFSLERQREGLGYNQRLEALSTENKRIKELAAKEIGEYGSRVREEVTTEMQNEIKFLASRVTELTQESIDVVEKMTKEKELFGNDIREQLTKERNELLEEAAKEKELYAEKIRQEVTIERDQEISKIGKELENIIIELENIKTERESLVDKDHANKKMLDALQEKMEKYIVYMNQLEEERDLFQQRLEDTEKDLQLTKENYGNDVEELDASRLELESSKKEIVKLKKQRQELVVMAEEFKNDCTNMSNELHKIKGHFKFAVLVEYEEKMIEMENEIERLETVIEGSKALDSDNIKKMSEQSSQLEQWKAREQHLETEMKRLSEALTSSVSEIESKDSRLTELRGVIQKKEDELSIMNESVRDLRKSLDLARLQNEQGTSNERIISTQIYEEKIASLNKELSKYKSSLEHCRCECKPSDKADADQQKNHEHLHERIQRLSVMLRVAEKNQDKEKADFDATKERLEKNLLVSEDTIDGLNTEVSRLRKLLYGPQKARREREGWQAPFTHDGQTPRMKNNIEKLKERELLDRIEEAEKVVDDAKQHRLESEETIQHLKDELSLRDEENRKIAQELHDSRLLFKEAVMSWQLETRSLKQIDQSRQSERTAIANTPQNLLQVIADNDSEDQENESLREKLSLSLEVQSDSWPRDDASKELQSIDQPHDANLSLEAVDDVSNPKAIEGGNETFTKMLDISEHTTSIEMRFDHSKRKQSVAEQSATRPPLTEEPFAEPVTEQLETENPVAEQKRTENTVAEHSVAEKPVAERSVAEKSLADQLESDRSESDQSGSEKSERDNASAIFNSLQEFKNDYKKYMDIKNSMDIAGNSSPGNKTAFVLGTNNKISRFSRAPQPHLDDDSSEQGRILDQPVNMSRRSSRVISELDTRDDSIPYNQRHQRSNTRDFSISLDSSQSTDNSERTTGTSSERSRVLRKRMSDLLEIKNSIKVKSNPYVTADAKHHYGRVAKQQRQQEIAISGTAATTTTTTTKTKPKTPPEAPWGLAAAKNPKLFKFLQSKSSSEEVNERRDALPFDENSKHGRRE